MTLDLDRLEAVAKAATPGPWEWEPPSKSDWPTSDESLVTSWKGDDGFAKSVVSGWGYDASGTDASDEDRVHIAAFSPDTVLTLISLARRAEKAEAKEREAWQVASIRLDAYTDAIRYFARLEVAIREALDEFDEEGWLGGKETRIVRRILTNALKGEDDGTD